MVCTNSNEVPFHLVGFLSKGLVIWTVSIIFSGVNSNNERSVPLREIVLRIRY